MCVKPFQAFVHLSVLRTATLSNSSGPGIYRRFIGQYRIQELPETEALYQTAGSQFWGSARPEPRCLGSVQQLSFREGWL